MSEPKTYTQEELDSKVQEALGNAKKTYQSDFDAQKIQIEKEAKASVVAEFSAFKDGLKDAFGVDDFEDVNALKDVVISKYSKGDVNVEETPEYRNIKSLLEKANGQANEYKAKAEKAEHLHQQYLIDTERKAVVGKVLGRLGGKTSISSDEIELLYSAQHKTKYENGKFIPLQADGSPKLDNNGNAITLEADLKAFATKYIIEDGGSGGGYGSGGGAPKGKKKSEMSSEEKGRYIAQYGQEAYFSLPNK